MKNPKVDFYFYKAEAWQQELEKLRTIILDCGLAEELKWGVPVYTFQQRNIALIHVFKEYCAVLFPKGVLLKDPHQILIQQTDNVQSARQVRFTDIGQVNQLAVILQTYIFEAIEVEKSGVKVPMKKTSEFPVAEEFQQQLDKMPSLKKAFEALTPGRQRAYLLHFSQPKQSKTRASRVEKCTEMILKGKGLND